MTGLANHVRQVLELPRTFFNLLALGLFYIKLYFILFFCDICFGYYLQKLNYVKRFLKNELLALIASLS